MNKQINFLSAKQLLIGSVLLGCATGSWANQWANYQGVERKSTTRPQAQVYTGNADRLSKPVPLQQPRYSYQHQPQYHRPAPYPVYLQQNGITVIYQQSLPTSTTYQQHQSGFVNGQNGSIESTQYMLISDWRRYGLPAPQVGMHWVYQHGRYIQISNQK